MSFRKESGDTLELLPFDRKSRYLVALFRALSRFYIILHRKYYYFAPGEPWHLNSESSSKIEIRTMDQYSTDEINSVHPVDRVADLWWPNENHGTYPYLFVKFEKVRADH